MNNLKPSVNQTVLAVLFAATLLALAYLTFKDGNSATFEGFGAKVELRGKSP